MTRNRQKEHQHSPWRSSWFPPQGRKTAVSRGQYGGGKVTIIQKATKKLTRKQRMQQQNSLSSSSAPDYGSTQWYKDERKKILGF